MSSVIKLLKIWLPDNPKLKFSFVGIEHPTDSRLHNKYQIQEAKNLAKDYPNQVQIISWMNYEEYCSWLQNLDLAIVIGKTGNESRFSIRTRFCELLENQIPIICNQGDYFSDWINRYKLGEVVSSENLLDSLNHWKDNLSVESVQYKEFYKAHSFENLAPCFKRFKLNINRNPKKSNPYTHMKPKGLYYRKHQLRNFSNNLISKIRAGKR